ncbi:CBN-VHA-19 protein [Caenorhabditis brenneri]|uniref:CBN-VHA-19 protein n=1 Tax=Caenorhabditis brenneri TaxID=135651 RepID=G0N275_CAEBE|nr:CBN-VHA-19 protein [Caenorhabditis brenneri]
MRVLFAVFSLIVACHAYDAVLFSNQREIGGISAEQLVKGATPEEPIVFIVNPDFTLGQFSVKANAYSAEPTTDYLAKSVKNSNFHESQYFANQIQASTAQVLTSADQYKSGNALYIIAGEEWTSMEQLAEQLISKIDNSVGIITSTDAVSHEKTNRVKRVATDEMDAANSDSTNGPQPNGAYAFPLVLPPYNNSGVKITPTADETCLFYLEGINIVVQQNLNKVLSYASVHIPGNNMTWSYAPGDAKCQNGGSIGQFIFRLRMTLTQDVSAKAGNNVAFSMKSGDLIDVSLNITGDLFGYWSLTGATMHNAKITAGTFKEAESVGKTIDERATQYSKINSVAGWSLVCSSSQAVFFPTNEESIQIGFSLANTQIQTFNIQNNKTWIANPHFTLQTEDCTGTFSAGSWMGIVSALVLIAGLMFGYVMLQSVQTMDRFDDPKQKQIVINVRE